MRQPTGRPERPGHGSGRCRRRRPDATGDWIRSAERTGAPIAEQTSQGSRARLRRATRSAPCARGGDPVLDRAVAQAASWRRAGLDLVVAVNISPRAISQALVARVPTVLDRHAVPALQLKLEITETALADDPDETITVLRELRAAGVQISLDDFGAGYTSLAYLTCPAADRAQDRPQFRGLAGGRPGEERGLAAVVELGHRLGLSIVAEGVETTAIRDHLLGLGCDAQQGYLYSKPVRPDQLEGWLVNTGTPVAVT